jgi:hypothetical protein
MKLESYIIREAFAAEDWPTVISALEKHFSIKILETTDMEIHRDKNNYPEIVVCDGNAQYAWCEHNGFRYWPAWGKKLPISIFCK